MLSTLEGNINLLINTHLMGETHRATSKVEAAVVVSSLIILGGVTHNIGSEESAYIHTNLVPTW